MASSMTSVPGIVAQVVALCQKMEAGIIAHTVHGKKTPTLKYMGKSSKKGKDLFLTAFEYVADQLSAVAEKRQSLHIEAILQEPLRVASNGRIRHADNKEDLVHFASIRAQADIWTAAMFETVRMCRETVDYIKKGDIDRAIMWTGFLKEELGSHLRAPESAELFPHEVGVVEQIHNALDTLHKHYRPFENHSCVISRRLENPALG